MKQALGVLVVAVALAASAEAVIAAPSTALAAAQHAPNVKWLASSVIKADFTCHGTKQQAILGTRGGKIVVAVFTRGLDKKPVLLEFEGAHRDIAALRLSAESLDFDPKGVDEDMGGPPEGMRPSKTCKGINLGDNDTDSTHIYWNHVRRRFDAWSQ